MLDVLLAAGNDTEAAAKSFEWLQWVLPGIFGGGLITAIGVVMRLRPEATSAAVIQANTAMEAMGKLIDELREERNEDREEIDGLKEERRSDKEKIRELEEAVAGLLVDVESWKKKAAKDLDDHVRETS